MIAVRPDSGPFLLLGEIHSGVLQNSRPITPESADEMLSLITDYPVRSWERPIRHAASGQVLTGVDCPLPSTGSPRRAIGTVGTEVSITGGQLLQASARTEVHVATESRRLPWSHYLARPGVLEVTGDFPAAHVAQTAEGFLAPSQPARTLDLTGICSGLMSRAQSSPLLDRSAPFRAVRSRLRWAALIEVGGRSATAGFTIEADGLRTLRITAPADVLDQLVALCESVALHDWLVTTVSAFVDRADLGQRNQEGVIRQLRPVIDHLLHTWMPTARLTDDVMPFWHEIDRRSGLSMHWDSLVQRVRDQLALAIIERTEPRRTTQTDLRTRTQSEPVVLR
jgi:hypothetical protein